MTRTPSAGPRADPGATTLNALAEQVWRNRYRVPGAETDITGTWQRVAGAVAAVDADPTACARDFMRALSGFRFLPGGRILAGAGTLANVTLANCFVMGRIDDSLVGVFDAMREGALTLQHGGGVGFDFSTLRPRGTPARGVDALAAGPVAFLRIFDAACAAITSSGARHGAMMATLRCDHPDIEEFIDAKRQPNTLSHCNLSVLVTDDFMAAVRHGRTWPLVFPLLPGDTPSATTSQMLTRGWAPDGAAVPCRVVRDVAATALWDNLCRHAHANGEPGVLFVDRINRANNLGYCEYLTATNPCAEAPLPPYGACHLGSLNLARFVSQPFTPDARVDVVGLTDITNVAVRFLDHVIDISRYPLFRQREMAMASRRIGLGITGLADALAMLGEPYQTAHARVLATNILTLVRDQAYRTSIDLARQHGAFPRFDREKYLQRPYIQSLPEELRSAVGKHGIRNSHLLALAPAGSISLLANNISSGIEPLRSLTEVRSLRTQQGGPLTGISASNHAFEVWRRRHTDQENLPPALCVQHPVDARSQLLMVGALQPLVDGSISKTVTLEPKASLPEVRQAFELADELGLKGITAYRLGSRTEPSGMTCDHPASWT